MTTETLHLKCTCSGEIIQFEIENDPDWRGHEFSIAIFSEYNNDGKRPWRDRLRWIWHLIKTGKPFGDQVVLNASHVKQLSEFLAANVQKLDGK